MAPPTKRAKAQKENCTLAREEVENRHKRIKRELREQVNTLTNEVGSIKHTISLRDVDLMKANGDLLHSKTENEELYTKLANVEELIREKEAMIKSLEVQLIEATKTTVILQETNRTLQQKVTTDRQQRTEYITDALLVQKQAAEYEETRKMKDLRNKVAELEASSPSRGKKWKSYGDIRKGPGGDK